MSREYVERTYRQGLNSGLATFQVVVEQTDLQVSAETDLTDLTRDSLRAHRHTLEEYLAAHPEFAAALKPLPLTTDEPLVEAMLTASRACGVGPLAAVAGVLAEFVGRDLLAASDRVIVENGGDVFVATREPRTLSIFAGESPLSQRVALRLAAEDQPVGVCTSAGTVGPSLSFGQADAATVVAKSTALADAAATAIANHIRTPADLDNALTFAQTVPGLLGVVVIKEDHLGAWGQVELVKV